jgi:hypothetical protein
MRHAARSLPVPGKSAIRKDAYERLHPETALGGVGRGQKKVRQIAEPSEDDIPERFTAALCVVRYKTRAAVPTAATYLKLPRSLLKTVAARALAVLQRGADGFAQYPPCRSNIHRNEIT